MIDVVIPTCKPYEQVKSLVAEVEATAGCPVNIIPTCQDASASFNRNLGLERANSDPIVMIDDDITHFPFGWVQRMAEVMEFHQDCVMLTAELLDRYYKPGLMMGVSHLERAPGGGCVEAVESRRLITACCAIRPNGITFDTRYQGSGFEDDDYSMQLREHYGVDGVWMIDHDTVVVHKNEMKFQREHFEENKRKFNEKWGVEWPNH